MQETVAHPGVAQGAGVDSVIDMLHNPLTFYQTAPVPGELDMVALVRQRLIDYGKKDIIEAVFDNSRHIREAIGKNSHAQQFHFGFVQAAHAGRIVINGADVISLGGLTGIGVTQTFGALLAQGETGSHCAAGSPA